MVLSSVHHLLCRSVCIKTNWINMNGWICLILKMNSKLKQITFELSDREIYVVTEVAKPKVSAVVYGTVYY